MDEEYNSRVLNLIFSMFNAVVSPDALPDHLIEELHRRGGR